MSMELDTVLHGVTPPPLESCEEKAKRQKTEPEPESDSESDSEPEPIDWDWVSKPIEYLQDKYEDDPIPRYFSCTRFVYKNKVVREQEEAEEKAVAEYLKTARNISPFDAIPIPPLANKFGHNWPRPVPIDDHEQPLLIRLSKCALEKYNKDNQGLKYEFKELVKAAISHIPLGSYYITFKATPKPEDVHPSNMSATTFQTHVCDCRPEPVIKSCSIKT